MTPPPLADSWYAAARRADRSVLSSLLTQVLRGVSYSRPAFGGTGLSQYYPLFGPEASLCLGTTHSFRWLAKGVVVAWASGRLSISTESGVSQWTIFLRVWNSLSINFDFESV
jgi:hypothetical protein